MNLDAHDPDERDWNRLISGLRDGDSVACGDFWNQYGQMLEAVASRQLSARIQQRVGPEDVVQSACRTFFRRMSDGQFELPDADALWRLMCAITMTKARKVARDQSRQKRGVNREQPLRAPNPAGESVQFDLAGDGSTPLQAAVVADQLQHLLSVLSTEECRVLDLKLQQFTNDEIATEIGCSERTVRRLTRKIQERWQDLADE